MANLTGKGCFKPGVSGNPGGKRRKDIANLSREARRYTHLAVGTLVRICRKGQERNQLAAAKEILDRGFGKPITMIDATLLSKKLNEMSAQELADLEMRLLTRNEDDGESAEMQQDMFSSLQ
jgi:hypothetical protein